MLTYTDMIHRFARAAGIGRRLILPVPVLTPRLSGLWVGLVTPVPAAVARPLAESLRHEVVCRENDLADALDDHGRLSVDTALRLALCRIREADVATRWSSASWPKASSDPLPTDPEWAGGSLYTDTRERPTHAPPEALWRVVEGIGGENGWYSWPLAWAARGWIDRAVGGVGLVRGRRDPRRLRVGDSLDFWRVEEVEPGRMLRLRAEMRLPGLAWLELRTEVRDGRTRSVPAAGPVPPARPGRAPLLVVGAPLPRRRVRLDGAQHRPCRGAGTTGSPVTVPGPAAMRRPEHEKAPDRANASQVGGFFSGWRWRESNPRPSAPHQGFSGRSPCCRSARLQRYHGQFADEPSHEGVPPGPRGLIPAVSPLNDAGHWAEDGPRPTESLSLRRRERTQCA